MKIKSTKRALILSAISLLLCVSMFVGTTFAWFTDSVESAKNQIVAGNLDVELEYAKVENGVKSEWATVAGAADIFDPEALWEPGRVEVVYLKVSNLGTLELKYQLGVNVYNEDYGINVDGDIFYLSDYLVFKVVEMPDDLTTYDDREAAALAAGSSMGLKDYNGRTTALEVSGVDYVALIVYMPETVGNEANYKTGTTAPKIELGVNLYATQMTAEKDSYGDDYDDEAWHPDMVVYNADDLKDALVNGGNIQLGADIVLTEAWEPIGTSAEPFNGTLDGNGYTVSNLTVNAEYAALVAYTGDNATIRNLTLENVNINSTKYAAGVVCMAGSGLTIDNVTVSGTIEATSYAGGIVMDADRATITNCENNATVTSKRASGIASWITNATVENVVNTGSISGTIGASGIAEAFSGSMKNATNKGTITSTGTEPASGIAGIQKGISTYEFCANHGDVKTTADNPNSSAAGILGQTPGTKATINYCANYGDITAEASYAAGIAYSQYGSVTANYCYNSGDISGADGAGGITPKAQYGSGDKANYCVVDATVTSANGTAYTICNNVVTSFFYDADTLYQYDKNGNHTTVTAKAAKTTLDTATGGIFFKVVNGRLTASVEYDWVGDIIVYDAAELQNALNSAVADYVILFGENITGNVTVSQKEGINITIDGRDNKYTGSITVNGNARSTGAETLTIKNINFVSDTKVNFISAPSKIDGKYNYSHNVTVDNCTFSATTYNENVVGIQVNSSYNLTVTNCTATNIHSLMQAESCGATVTVDKATVVNCKSGVSFNNTRKAVITNSNIESVANGGYGVRVKAENNDYSLTMENCTIEAFVPVLVRNATKTYTVTVSGNNTLTANNSFDYEVVVCTGDWDDDSSAPAAPTGNITLVGTDALNVFKG